VRSSVNAVSKSPSPWASIAGNRVVTCSTISGVEASAGTDQLGEVLGVALGQRVGSGLERFAVAGERLTRGGTCEVDMLHQQAVECGAELFGEGSQAGLLVSDAFGGRAYDGETDPRTGSFRLGAWLANLRAAVAREPIENVKNPQNRVPGPFRPNIASLGRATRPVTTPARAGPRRPARRLDAPDSTGPP
jgi:hypothetical protein